MAMKHEKNPAEWNALVDELFALDVANPWFSQTVEPDEAENPHHPLRGLNLHQRPYVAKLALLLDAAWDENLHPRDAHGRFGSGGEQSLVETLPRPRAIAVNSIEEAIPLVLAGKVVELPDVQSAATLINRLADMATDAASRGERAPNYNLCSVSVKGTNLFCAESLVTKEYPNGVPRIDMPQLAGAPVPGSPADHLPRSEWEPSNVDASAQFIEHLRSTGIRVDDVDVKADRLKASQDELIGPKVAKMVRDPNLDPTKFPIFISRDNYIIDGHHRWAATIGREVQSGNLGSLMMHTHRIDAPITEVLHLANAWTKQFGIQQAAGVNIPTPAQPPSRGLSDDGYAERLDLASDAEVEDIFDILSLEFDESKVTRDARGRFGSGGGGREKVDWVAAGKKAAEAAARHKAQYEAGKTVTAGKLAEKQQGERLAKAQEVEKAKQDAVRDKFADAGRKAADARARHQEQFDAGKTVTAGVLRDKQAEERAKGQAQPPAAKPPSPSEQSRLDRAAEDRMAQAMKDAQNRIADKGRGDEMRAQWEQAKADAAARAARAGEPPPFHDAPPGAAEYRGGLITANDVDTSLSHPVPLTATSQKILGDETRGNANVTIKLTTPDGSYAFKPIDGERIKSPWGGYVRDAITNEKAPLAEREVLASRVDQALGLGIVPRTILSNATYHDPSSGATVTKTGSAQEYAKGLRTRIPLTQFYGGDANQQYKPAEVARMGVLDAVIGNLDRHGGNFGLAGGKLVAIDHGYSFGHSPIVAGRGVGNLRTPALAFIKPGHLAVTEQKSLAEKLDHMNWSKVLKDSHLDAEERRTLKERAQTVADQLRQGNAHKLQDIFKASRF
jgi:phosphoinositide 3-/4-kinase-like protein